MNSLNISILPSILSWNRGLSTKQAVVMKLRRTIIHNSKNSVFPRIREQIRMLENMSRRRTKNMLNVGMYELNLISWSSQMADHRLLNLTNTSGLLTLNLFLLTKRAEIKIPKTRADKRTHDVKYEAFSNPVTVCLIIISIDPQTLRSRQSSIKSLINSPLICSNSSLYESILFLQHFTLLKAFTKAYLQITLNMKSESQTKDRNMEARIYPVSKPAYSACS